MSLLTLTAMLLHAALGCWWHHGHGHSEPQPDQLHAVEAARSCSCARHGTGDRLERQSADEADSVAATVPRQDEDCPSEHEGCCEDTCQYLTAGTPKTPAPDDAQPFVTLLACGKVVTARVVAELEGVRRWGNSSLATASARDLTQVWQL